MAGFLDVIKAPSLANPLLDALIGPTIYKPGFSVVYALAGRAGTQGSGNTGGILWRSGGAADAFRDAVAAWNAVSNLEIKSSPFYYAEGQDRSSFITWVEKLGFRDSNPDELGLHDTPGVPEQVGEFNAQSAVWSHENNALGGYNFITFLHEIGHGLGLEHPHDSGLFPGVDGVADIGEFGLNQGLYTVMSYNDGSDRAGYSPSLAYGWMTTPGALDIAAIQAVYGADMTTKTGHDDYALPLLNEPGTGFSCIWDAGGIDTISAATASADCTIDLRPATLRVEEGGGGFLSQVEGVFGGFTIASGVTIENAAGGRGDDWLIGNAGANRLVGGDGDDVVAGGAGQDVLVGGSGHDVLSGESGNDRFEGALDDLAGDLLLDFALGERLHVTDVLDGFSPRQVGTALDLGGGRVVTLQQGADFRVAVATGLSGVDIDAARRVVEDDFDGDGRSDILWRNTSGYLTTWSGSAGGWNGVTGVGETISADWKVAGASDFNGDGVSDILWRNDNGRITDWFGTGRGFNGATGVDYYVGTDWKVAAVGDVTGDGRDDIVWRNDNGAMTVWRASDAGFDGTRGYDFVVDTGWKIAGVGDANGDGLDDMLWRHDDGAVTTWTATQTGFATANYTLAVGADWKVAAFADFNGDDRADILWRNDNGALTSWLSTDDGFTPNGQFALSVPTAWAVAATGDYNGDGMADILWRNADGQLAEWLSTGPGFDPNPGASLVIGTEWGVFG